MNKTYEFLQKVGAGSFGKCWTVLRRSDKKILLCKIVKNANFTKELPLEVNILKNLNHRYIVKFYDYVEEHSEERYHILMEYCVKRDLSTLIQKHKLNDLPFQEKFILQVLVQLTEALVECHRSSDNKQTLIHRDLKPQNVFLDSNFNVKLGDFGAACELPTGKMERQWAGTPIYMSPEVHSRTGYNEKTDIFSLGCILSELCIRTPVFRDSNITGLKHRDEPLIKSIVEKISTNYSKELTSLVSEMLHYKVLIGCVLAPA